MNWRVHIKTGGFSYIFYPRTNSTMLGGFLAQLPPQKLIFWGWNWVHWKDNLLKENWIFSLIFWHLRHFRAISLWKKQGPFYPWSFWWGLTQSAVINCFIGYKLNNSVGQLCIIAIQFATEPSTVKFNASKCVKFLNFFFYYVIFDLFYWTDIFIFYPPLASWKHCILII